MISRAEYYEAYKIRRRNRALGTYNHPHRLASIIFSGSLHLQAGEIDFDSPGLTTGKVDYSLDFSNIPGVTRVFSQNPPNPWLTIADENEIHLIHYPGNWAFGSNLVYIGDEAGTEIGTETITSYSRPTVDDPWEENDPIIIPIYAYPDLRISGGRPTWTDTPEDEDHARVGIYYNIPGFGFLDDLPILRLPWVDAWAPESAVYADAVQEHIDANPGLSGTCSIALNFT